MESHSEKGHNFFKKTIYSQHALLKKHPKDPDLKKVPEGLCSGTSTIDIINFLQNKNKPYPLSNFKDAKEAAREQNAYKEAFLKGNPNYSIDKIADSGTILSISQKSLVPTKSETNNFILNEFEDCQNQSKIMAQQHNVHDEEVKCAKYIGIKSYGNHAISLKKEGDYCSYSDPDGIQYEGSCKNVPQKASEAFTIGYFPSKLSSYTFIKLPEKKDIREQNETTSKSNNPF